MPQQPPQLPLAALTGEPAARTRGAQALRLMAVLAMGVMLAACGRCGDFLPSGQIGACHSDSPPR